MTKPPAAKEEEEEGDAAAAGWGVSRRGARSKQAALTEDEEEAGASTRKRRRRGQRGRGVREEAEEGVHAELVEEEAPDPEGPAVRRLRVGGEEVDDGCAAGQEDRGGGIGEGGPAAQPPRASWRTHSRCTWQR